MLVNFVDNNHALVAWREPGETRCPTESVFWHRLRNALRATGLDVVKKRPSADGAMSSAPWYLRDRRGEWCVYDTYYMVRDPSKQFNNELSVRLVVAGVERE